MNFSKNTLPSIAKKGGSEKIKNLRDAIDKNYKNDELMRLFPKSFLSEFIIKNTEELNKTEINIQDILKGSKKRSLVVFFSEILMNQTLFKNMLVIAGEDFGKILEFLLWNHGAYVYEIEEKFNIKIIEKEEQYYRRDSFRLTPWYLMFSQRETYSYYGKDSELYLCLQDEIKQCLYPYYTTEEDYFLTGKPSPPKAQFTFEKHDKIAKELTIYLKLVDQGKITYSSKNNAPLKSTINKIQKAFTFSEFYNSNEKKCAELNSLKTSLILSILCYIKKNKSTTDSKSIIRESLLNLLDIYDPSDFNFLFKHLTRVDFYYDCNKHIGKSIKNILKSLPINSWVTIDEVFKYSDLNELPLNPLSIGRYRTRMQFKYKKGNSTYDRYNTHVDITHENKVVLGKEPIIKGFFFLCGAFGLIDIAYDFPKSEGFTTDSGYISIYDGLKAIRLNPFGAYVMFRSKDYKLKGSESEESVVEFDDKNLIVTMSKEDPFKKLVFDGFGTQLSKKRYLITHQSMHKGCKTKEELVSKIESLKKECKKNLPSNWSLFLDQVTAQFKPLEKQSEYEVYQIENDKKLLQIIAQDQTIRKYILKAENYKILIKKKDVEKIKIAFEKKGYCI